MRAALVVAIAVVAIAAWGGFLGLGYGVGTLAITAAGQTYGGGNFLPSYGNGSDSPNTALSPSTPSPTLTNGALTFHITNNVQQSGSPIVSSLTPTGESIPLSFGMVVSSNGNCGNDADPVSNIGQTEPAWYIVQFLSSTGAVQNVTWEINGNQVEETAVPISMNNTESNDQMLVGCDYDSNGPGNIYSINIYPPHQTLPVFAALGTSAATVGIIGQVGAGTIKVTLFVEGFQCSGTSKASGPGACGQFQYTYGNNNPIQSQASPWLAVSTLSVPVLPGAGSAKLDGGGPWFNGGTLTVSVWTGYGGLGGYELEIYYPQSRSGVGGQEDAGFAPITVANNLAGAQFSWTIPAGTSILCAQPGCNNFELALYSSLFQDTLLLFPVDISPGYAPAIPAITYSTGSGYIYPSVGDSLTITLTTSNSNATRVNAVETFLLQAFYLQPEQATSSPPGCGGQWITNCTAVSLTPQQAGSGVFTAQWTIPKVDPPLGDTQIGIIAQAEANGQQSSGLAAFTVPIQPVTCEAGQVCNPPTTFADVALWETWGPILLALAIGSTFALLIAAVPKPPVIVGIAVAVLVVAALWVIAIGPAFNPGGFLDHATAFLVQP
jgi:hypothetical protein